jgi:DNA polymerase bacteriophage-type
MCDLETFSPTPITDGTHRYAEQAEVLLFPYAADDEAPKIWDVTTGERMPSQLEDGLSDERVLTIWHNGGAFDSTILKHAMPDIILPPERMYDTLSQALTHGLPGALGALCEIMGVAEADKKVEGKTFINLFCRPPAKNLRRERATRHTHPIEWEAFKHYAMQDIPSMRAIYRKMPKWNLPLVGPEKELWNMDHRINNLGFQLDVDLIHAAIRAIDRAQKNLGERTVELTDGEIARTTQRDKLLAHLLAEYGVELPDLKKDTLERRIGDENLPWQLRELLSIRLQASASSTSKYKKALKGMSSDGRARGCLQFSGASRTRRWSGKLLQPQNYFRPKIGKLKDEALQKEVELGIAAMKANCEDIIFDNVMEVASSSLRGMIIAPRGKKLVVADLAGIENRDAAWLAKEQWKLEALREFDAGRGDDLYVLEYARAFSVDPASVTKYQRTIGKVLALSMQYAGGVGAFMSMAMIYGIDLEELAEHTWDTLPADIQSDAEGMYEWTVRKKRSTFGLSKRAYCCCEGLKRMWRDANPSIVAHWAEIQECVVRAVTHPGVTVPCGKTRMRRDGNWLRIRLPSGNYLVYPSPKVDDRGQFTYNGASPYSRKWGRQKTFGGKIFNSYCQSLARDIMAANMPAVQAAGYDIVLSIHDELICEAPDSSDFNHEHLSSLLATVPSWAEGLPLAAAGFEAYRYRKD